MRLCGVRRIRGVGRGVDFLLGVKKLLPRVPWFLPADLVCVNTSW